MKAVFVCFFLIFCKAQCTPIQEKEFEIIKFVDEKGILRVIDLNDDTPPTVRFDPEVDIEYGVYTRKNPTTPQIFKKRDEASLAATNFDATKPVKITIHGWTGDAESGVNTVVGPAFLEAVDVNIVAVDWSNGSSGGYTQSVRNVPGAGQSVADMINWLNSLGVPYSNIHILGHSLGAHVVGFAGRLSNGTIEYITGLDPASPSWTSSSERLRRTDAKYVEIIHTNIGQLGLLDAIGHNDFYPNGGVQMPGCDGNLYCSHYRSWEYMADSLDHEKFMANRCNDVNEITNGNCANLGKLYMGGSKIKPGDGGIYALKTNAEKPYYIE
ncbi:pancreatic lipase-related protein 2-like [Arctopsyche grandis]|uniref:pancreatic lipase-related protein 2-like n=1 Tax=Arctopsyche grandis TaxID=121162 RepID=UPI00406D7AFF